MSQSSPPPYNEITGLYVQNDKHVDASFSEYNGNARPGQLVVDTDTYSLYIGNSEGSLNAVSSGGSYGNTQVAAFLPTYTGNITAGNATVSGRTFVGSGNVTAPGVSFSADGAQDTGVYWISDGVMGVATNGVQSARFSQTGSTFVGYVRTTPTTVGALPSAAGIAGARAFVTDAGVNTFGTALTAGGSNAVPVYSTGSGWIVG